MKPLTFAEKVDLLLSDLDRVEPVSFDLGTPELFEIDAMQEIVNMGTEIVPILLEHIQRSGSKTRIAYIVLVLNNIGDIRALTPLLALRARYQALETKDEWDYAVIGQCNLAIKKLEEKKRGQSRNQPRNGPSEGK